MSSGNETTQLKQPQILTMRPLLRFQPGTNANGIQTVDWNRVKQIEKDQYDHFAMHKRDSGQRSKWATVVARNANSSP